MPRLSALCVTTYFVPLHNRTSAATRVLVLSRGKPTVERRSCLPRTTYTFVTTCPLPSPSVQPPLSSTFPPHRAYIRRPSPSSKPRSRVRTPSIFSCLFSSPVLPHPSPPVLLHSATLTALGLSLPPSPSPSPLFPLLIVSCVPRPHPPCALFAYLQSRALNHQKRSVFLRCTHRSNF